MQENKSWIVVEDRQGDFWEGSLVDDKRAAQLRARHVALLPVIPDLFRSAGIGGYHKRSWGAGWSLNSATPRCASPMTMYISKTFSVIHWCARLVPDGADFLQKIMAGENLNGFLRICNDGSQVIPNKLGMTTEDTVDARELTKLQLLDGGFLVGGKATAMVPTDGIYGFGLYGTMPGLRVAWSAVSQAQI